MQTLNVSNILILHKFDQSLARRSGINFFYVCYKVEKLSKQCGIMISLISHQIFLLVLINIRSPCINYMQYP